MTKLLMIRHGQSVANVERIFAGHLDSPLTQLGQRQAQLTANYLYSHYPVDRVYTSDLSRAYTTGKTVADLFGLPVISHIELREIFAGLWEGESYDLLPERFAHSYAVWMKDIGNAVCDGGESVAALQSRVLGILRRICHENPDKCVVVATHATPIRALQCHCEGKCLAQMKDVPWVSNASISSFVYENGVFNIDFVSYDTHLGQLTSVLPENC